MDTEWWSLNSLVLEQTSVEILDPNSDLEIQLLINYRKPTSPVNESSAKQSPEIVSKSYTVHASTNALSLASPVFAAMFRVNRFAEGQQLKSNGKTTVTLNEDNGRAMVLVLRIVHHQTQGVPLALTCNSVYKVAVICDKYDMAGAMKPWYQVWAMSIKQQYDGELQALRGGKWKPENLSSESTLFAAWVFRDSELFKLVTCILLFTKELDPDEKYTWAVNLPTSVTNWLESTRTNYIQKILENLQELFFLYLSPSSANLIPCPRHRKGLCNIMNLGIFCQWLWSIHLYPLSDPTKMAYPRSLQKLFSEMRRVPNNDLLNECAVAGIIKKKSIGFGEAIEGANLELFLSETTKSQKRKREGDPEGEKVLM